MTDDKKFKDKIIQLSHGDGGIKTGELINNLLLGYFGNEILNKLEGKKVKYKLNVKENGVTLNLSFPE